MALGHEAWDILPAEIAAQQAADAFDLEHQVAIYEQMEKRGEEELYHYETTLAEERVFLQRQYELKLQQQQQQQAFKQEMAMMEVRPIVLLGIGSGAILVVTLAVAYYLYTCGQARLLQVPRAEGRRQAAETEKEQLGRQPASVVSRRAIIPEDRQVTPSYQDQQGGDGRRPRVRLHGQG